MKYISLFAGIGGFDLALTRLGHTCVWANEWDKYASILYNRNFGTGGDTPCDTRDIRTVQTREIPDHELLVGGFPCQAFSIAGKRRGFDDTRGTLFFEIARILKDKQPKLFILENVKGLLSHDSGNTFRTIISTLTELGYDLQWQVLNSKNFGVPQNRERVFIVGNLRGEPRPEVLPIGDSNEVFNEQNQISATLDSNYHKGANWNRTFINQLNEPTHSNDRVYGDSGVSPSLNTMQGGRRQPKILAWSKSHRTGKSEADKRRKNYGQVEHRIKEGEFNTLSTGVGGSSQSTSNFVANDMKIRRLTPLECERLQGFPDGWTEGVSDTQRYKCLGNAVTVNVVEEIAKRL